jgi:hypothetical protein
MCEKAQRQKRSLFEEKMDTKCNDSGALAAAITKAASKQTYYTIRLFVDRGRVKDAYRAYGYFRWVDDVIDAEAPSDNTGIKPVLSDIVPFGEVEASQKLAFVNRQKSLLEACYRAKRRKVCAMKNGC